MKWWVVCLHLWSKNGRSVWCFKNAFAVVKNFKLSLQYILGRMAVRTFSSTKVIWAIFYGLVQLLQVVVVIVNQSIFNQSIFSLVENCKFNVYKSCSVMSPSLQFHGLYPTRLPCPENIPGNNSGVGHCFPFQRIFWPRDRIRVSSIAGGFFTIWAIRVNE